MQDFFFFFARTGSVADYLKYKEQERRQAQNISAENMLGSYENYNQGACDKRTNNGGE